MFSITIMIINVNVIPLDEVLELIDELAAKVTKEGEAEAKAFKEHHE